MKPVPHHQLLARQRKETVDVCDRVHLPVIVVGHTVHDLLVLNVKVVVVEVESTHLDLVAVHEVLDADQDVVSSRNKYHGTTGTS